MKRSMNVVPPWTPIHTLYDMIQYLELEFQKILLSLLHGRKGLSSQDQSPGKPVQDEVADTDPYEGVSSSAVECTCRTHPDV